MDSNIEGVIIARKNVFDSYGKLDSATRKKIEELFVKIEELGKSCQDVPDFEAKFAASPLNSEYTNLIIEAASKMASEIKPYVPSIEDIAKQDLKQAGRDLLRDTPVGDVMQAKQTLDLFRKHN